MLPSRRMEISCRHLRPGQNRFIRSRIHSSHSRVLVVVLGLVSSRPYRPCGFPYLLFRRRTVNPGNVLSRRTRAAVAAAMLLIVTALASAQDPSTSSPQNDSLAASVRDLQAQVK